jgi:hypothetical protein
MLAARIARAARPLARARAGLLTRAVAVVVGGAFSGLAITQRIDSTSAWAAFFGVALGLGAAIAGGALGATFGRTASPPVISQPIAPSHGQPV